MKTFPSIVYLLQLLAWNRSQFLYLLVQPFLHFHLWLLVGLIQSVYYSLFITYSLLSIFFTFYQNAVDCFLKVYKTLIDLFTLSSYLLCNESMQVSVVQ